MVHSGLDDSVGNAMRECLAICDQDLDESDHDMDMIGSEIGKAEGAEGSKLQQRSRKRKRVRHHAWRHRSAGSVPGICRSVQAKTTWYVSQVFFEWLTLRGRARRELGQAVDDHVVLVAIKLRVMRGSRSVATRSSFLSGPLSRNWWRVQKSMGHKVLWKLDFFERGK